jgi:hypothetical protein
MGLDGGGAGGGEVTVEPAIGTWSMFISALILSCHLDISGSEFASLTFCGQTQPAGAFPKAGMVYDVWTDAAERGLGESVSLNVCINTADRGVCFNQISFKKLTHS